MNYIPIKKAAKLQELDDAEVIEGYRDGRKNEPKPRGNRSYSYWHGWNNGMVDARHMDKQEWQAELAKDYLHIQKENI